jgi:hypothetical protein
LPLLLREENTGWKIRLSNEDLSHKPLAPRRVQGKEGGGIESLLWISRR